MTKQHTILTLPDQDVEFDKIVSDEGHKIANIEFSSTTTSEGVKHYALVVWHQQEYGDDNF